MIKVKDITEIIQNNVLIQKDLRGYDLSDLDLSKVAPEVWKGAFFGNTNFENTNIKFFPLQLEHINNFGEPIVTIDHCNFKNCNLSYLTEANFKNVDFHGCNFENTGLKINFSKMAKQLEPLSFFGRGLNLMGVRLDSYYQQFPSSYFDQTMLDVDAILKNPHCHFSSSQIWQGIQQSIPDYDTFISPKETQKIIKLCEEVLAYDRDGQLKALYEHLSQETLTTPLDKLCFFQGLILNKHFSHLDLSFISPPMWKLFQMENCTFDELVLKEEFDYLMNQQVHNRYFIWGEKTKIHKIVIPTVNLHSWSVINKDRLVNSPVTFRTNLYLELGRSCNAKCSFCRNQYLENEPYSLENIVDSLSTILDHLDSIVIGGGEPTLRIKDLEVLKTKIPRKVPTYIFTNGSLPFKQYEDLMSFFDLNISRHAVDDDENAAIFGLSPNQLLSSEDLKKLMEEAYRNLTLCATCFKGAIDQPEKIFDYITYATKLEYNNILFQSLHQDMAEEVCSEIDPAVFQEVIKYLVTLGYEKSLPIYSSGDYRLFILKRGRQSISFKEYISQEELEQNWPYAVKRTFDLSMDPSGNIYENWHQSTGKVYLKKA